jgi:SAM-dependent methyltransferase
VAYEDDRLKGSRLPRAEDSAKTDDSAAQSSGARSAFLVKRAVNSLWNRLWAGQFRKPGGILGRFVSDTMLERNKGPYDWMLSKLCIRPNERVLEIGFGPGYGILEVLKRISDKEGTVAGIDFSKAMCKKAAAAVRRSPCRADVRLEFGDAAKMPFSDASFSLVYALNVVYFWTDLLCCFREIFRVLAPGGRAAVFFADAASLQELPVTRTGVFAFYHPQDLAEAMTEAGFEPPEHRIEKITSGRTRTGHLMIAAKPK